MEAIDKKLEAFARLLKIMDDLRAHCPWDRKQTMASLRNLTIEETYELADAIIANDLEEVKEELGDIMLHMVFYAKIADEKGAFDISDVLHTVCDKLVERHPHVYGTTKVADEEEVKQNWEQIKLKSGKKSVLSGVPNSLPAMVKAYRMQEKTKQVGFEWKHAEGAWEKLGEEISELKEALNAVETSEESIEEEFGDVLFSLINVGRYHGIEAESALAKVNNKFKSRFEFIERESSKALSDMTLAEMDVLWERAKEEATQSHP